MTYPTLTLSRGGTQIELSRANGYDILPGLEGLDTPPVSLSETDPADFDGSIVTNVRHEPREVFLPLLLQGDGDGGIRRATRRLASLLNPRLGATTLTVTHPPEVPGNQLSASASDGVATAFDAGTGDTLTTVSSPVRTSSNALQITGTSPLTAAVKQAERVTVIPGATYTAAAYVRASSTTSTGCHVQLLWYDASNTLISTTWSDAVTSSSSAWRLGSVTASAPDDAATVGIGVYAASQTHIWDDLSVVEDDTIRRITGYLSEPLGTSLGATEVAGWRRMGLTLRCPDPLWLGAQSAGALSAPGNNVTTQPLAHSGDASSWPSFQISMKVGVDPGDGVEVALLPAGKTSLDTAVGGFKVLFDSSTSPLIINTDPRSLTVVRGDGSSGWSRIGQLAGTPSGIKNFFAIPPGVWSLHRLEIVNVLPGAATGTMSLTSRWLTAW